jgi:hypothetical protein
MPPAAGARRGAILKRKICGRGRAAIKLQFRKLNSNLAAWRSKVPHLLDFSAFRNPILTANLMAPL